MAKLYNTNFKNNDYISKVEELDGKTIWTISKNDKVEVLISIDSKKEEISIDGSFENIYKHAKDVSKYSIFLNMKKEETIIKLDNSKKTVFSYADTDFQSFKENGKYYYPFTLLNLALQNYTNHKYFYNYTNIYEFDEYDNLSGIELYKDENDENNVTALREMEKYVEDNYKEKDPYGNPLMPMYLRLNNRSEFTFIFNNFYGLSKVRNIESMKEFFQVYGIYDDMINDNAAVRGRAYHLATFILEDQHTAKANITNNAWGETNGGRDVSPSSSSALIDERRSLSLSLNNNRKEVLKKAGYTEDNMNEAILYSEDGLTAYFYFDSFDATNNAYTKDNALKSDDVLAKEDSYFFFVKQLNAIKNHVTKVDGNDVKVQNVIIDDSLNGGGFIYILGKLLALMSKDNSATMYIQNDLTNDIAKTTFHVDSNKDGVYDNKDCYGNDFSFYILTSPNSFSCGNAFPFIASKFDNVKVIGVRSGGGECVVGNAVLSNAVNLYHSSNEHLIMFNEENKNISGVEDGKQTDYSVFYHNFYNIEELNKLIKEKKQA